MTQLVLDKVVKRYTAATPAAVSELSLEIPSGELVALLGPSGCGKTTTLKMIAGLLSPDSGDIRFDNQSVVGLQAEKRRAAMVFQNHLLFTHMNVFDNVGFGLRMRHQSKTEISKQVNGLLERVQLGGYGLRQPHELSGGQQQRVALARALVTRPKLLLLDEPLSSLDADLRTDMRNLIRELQRESGVTTIMVTHDQGDSIAIADRIALMMDGELKQYSPAAGFVNSPVDEETARFFGNENFIPGKLVNQQFHSALGQLNVREDLQRKLAHSATPGSTATIRAENIVLVDSLDYDNAIEVTLRWATIVGNFLRLGVVSDNAVDGENVELTIICHQRELSDTRIGQKLNIRLPAEYLWAF